MEHAISFVPAVISDGETSTGLIKLLMGESVVAIYHDDTLEGASLSIKSSPKEDAAMLADIVITATPYAVAVDDSKAEHLPLDTEIMGAVRFLSIESNVAQTGDTTLYLAVRSV